MFNNAKSQIESAAPGLDMASLEELLVKITTPAGRKADTSADNWMSSMKEAYGKTSVLWCQNIKNEQLNVTEFLVDDV